LYLHIATLASILRGRSPVLGILVKITVIYKEAGVKAGTVKSIATPP
jgi:hypothetical protein